MTTGRTKGSGFTDFWSVCHSQAEFLELLNPLLNLGLTENYKIEGAHKQLAGQTLEGSFLRDDRPHKFVMTGQHWTRLTQSQGSDTISIDKANIISSYCGVDLLEVLRVITRKLPPKPKGLKERVSAALRELAPQAVYGLCRKKPPKTFIPSGWHRVLVSTINETQAPVTDILYALLSDVNGDGLQRLKDSYPADYESFRILIERQPNALLEPLADERVASGFSKIVGPMRDGADRIIGWGEFLPCSMVPHSFMHKYHHQIFMRSLGKVASEQAAKSCIDAMDRIGDNNKEMTKQKLLAKDRFTFCHVLDRRTIDDICNSRNLFSDIDEQERSSLAAHLNDLRNLYPHRMEIRWTDKQNAFNQMETGAAGVEIESAFVLMRGADILCAVEQLPTSDMQVFVGPDRARRTFEIVAGRLATANPDGLSLLLEELVKNQEE